MNCSLSQRPAAAAAAEHTAAPVCWLLYKRAKYSDGGGSGSWPVKELFQVLRVRSADIARRLGREPGGRGGQRPRVVRAGGQRRRALCWPRVVRAPCLLRPDRLRQRGGGGLQVVRRVRAHTREFVVVDVERVAARKQRNLSGDRARQAVAVQRPAARLLRVSTSLAGSSMRRAQQGAVQKGSPGTFRKNAQGRELCEVSYVG